MDTEVPVASAEVCRLQSKVRDTVLGLGGYWRATGLENAMDGNLLSPRWRFPFGNLTFFIATFAPFYDHKHPRYSQTADTAFVFMQPEFSFDLHGIHAGNAKRGLVKSTIRDSFERDGSGYSIDLVEQPIEAFKVHQPSR